MIELPGGRTRLEGSTWSALDIHPGWYWTPWADWIVHSIHRRVLEHIRRLSETQFEPPTGAQSAGAAATIAR